MSLSSASIRSSLSGSGLGGGAELSVIGPSIEGLGRSYLIGVSDSSFSTSALTNFS